MRAVDVKVEYVKVHGGLDIVTPAMSLDPGKAQAALNHEAGDNGGLSRIQGFERFDGRPAPSSATYYYCPVEIDGTIAVGNTITGGTSGATGLILEVWYNGASVTTVTASGERIYVAFTRLTGTFAAVEDLEIAASVEGELLEDPLEKAHPRSVDNAYALYLAGESYRADIAVPIGSGPVRGGGKLDGTLYVFRDNAGGTAGNLWRSSATGWQQVSLFHEISFDTGSGTIEDGNTVTQLISGASGLVRRAVRESGAWEANAAGRLIISDITGTFDATNELQVGAVTQATATSLATAITIPAGGIYETVNYNFFGGAATYRMYGCNGVGRGFEFDGTVFVPIDSTMTPDTPDRVAPHKKHLSFGFGNSFQVSGIGFPYVWTPLAGADQLGMGEDITNLIPLPGEALGVIGERGSHQLLGTSTLNFQLNTIAGDVGGVERTAQVLGGTGVMVSDHGVTRLSAAEAYGNFEQNSMSRDVQAIIDALKEIAVGSTIRRSRNQYKLFGSNGSGIIATASAEKIGLDWVPVYYFTPFKYPINISAVIPCDDDTTYVCDDDGMVYQIDKGTSFDGDEIEAYFRLVFNHSKSPSTIKSYLKANFEVAAEGYSAIRIHPEFTYGDPKHAQHLLQEEELTGVGGMWDVDNWEEFYWDSRLVSSPSISIRGNGQNIAMVFYSKSAIDQGYKVDGVTFHYIPRRLQR